jgi:sulfite reductase (NADPH) flavoprotein alpha-component
MFSGHREEIEAHVQDGILTHIGMAFSRDTNKKVYIQHKMKEDRDMILDLFDKQGVFYLCGPTW